MSLTLILGASRSGTSMVAQLCHANGAWMGDVTLKEYDPQAGYDQYENRAFRTLCRNMLHIDNNLPQAGLYVRMRAFLDSLPTDTEPVVLKYPKAFLLLPFFRSQCDLDAKIVYVIRDPWRRGTSVIKKDAASFTQSLSEWEMAYNAMAVHTRGLSLHIAMFERFFYYPAGETVALLDFIGIDYKIPVDISCIDDKKRSA